MVKRTQHFDKNGWTNVALGIWNSGGIRSGNIDKKYNGMYNFKLKMNE